MKRQPIISTISFLYLLIGLHIQAQISYGGSPLPLAVTRSDAHLPYEQMPAFDVAEQLRLDSLSESDLRSGYHFAYKFMTRFTPENSGVHFTLADGTRVWRLGISSTGALSLNILFTRYKLPEGARLFLYNPDQTQVLGAFNHLNNSELELLPVAPVRGDKLIIEYQEPAQATFPAELEIGEVNHGYRDFKSYEPQPDQTALACIPAIACLQDTTDQYDKISRSVVLLTINGNVACSGVLLNNTENNGKPYLLTASHCLNGQFTVLNPDYGKIAGSIVCFFNYNSPLCKPVMKGTEEMSVSSAWCRAVNEQTDMALLELISTPPVYYQPYYAGWNAADQGETPYIGIHHPAGSTKRFNLLEHNVSLVNYFLPSTIDFGAKFHWKVDRWTLGCTAGGSSGSPLFDARQRVVGALTGGYSECEKPIEDYYFALCKSWEPEPEPDLQLKYWLNPGEKAASPLCEGMDPYATSPCFRLSNIRETGKAHMIETTRLPSGDSDYMFGVNTLETSEYAEAYKINGKAILYGTYLVTPTLFLDEKTTVEIRVYKGDTHPEELLYTEQFRPSYTGWNGNEQDFTQLKKASGYEQESFVLFSKPVTVNHSFFIGYKITSSEESSFTVFNLRQGETTANTAWLSYKNKWTEATAHPTRPFATSLFIDPVIQYDTDTRNENIPSLPPIRIFTGAEGKTINLLLPETVHKADCSILSLDGKILFQETLSIPYSTLSASFLQPGIYLIKVNYDNNIYTQKIIF